MAGDFFSVNRAHPARGTLVPLAPNGWRRKESMKRDGSDEDDHLIQARRLHRARIDRAITSTARDP